MKFVAETARPVRWVIELDYDADPDVAPEDLREDIADELSGAKGSPVVEGDLLILDNLDDAVSVRMRFDEYIYRIDQEYA